MENLSEVTISIGEVAKELGISTKTLRRSVDKGQIKFERSPTGQRRLYLADIKRITPYSGSVGGAAFFVALGIIWGNKTLPRPHNWGI